MPASSAAGCNHQCLLGRPTEVLREACAHYEQVAERKRLLLDLKEHISRCQALLQSQPETEELARAGAALLARLEQVSP